MENLLKDFMPVKEIMEKDSGEELDMWEDMGRIFIDGLETELMLRFHEYNKTIVIARIEVKNKRKKVATTILEYLKSYAKTHGYENIMIESTLTPEIHRFAESHQFKEIDGQYYYQSEDGERYGNYLLKL